MVPGKCSVMVSASQPIFPVGGITPQNMAAFRAAGASGFGIGSSIYTTGVTADVVALRAAVFVKAWAEVAQ